MMLFCLVFSAVRFWHDERHLWDRLLQKGWKGPASCEMDGPWVAEGWSFYSSLRLLVSWQCVKTCVIVVGQHMWYVWITNEPFCVCPGHLAWCYGRSVLWLSSHTRGCPMNRSLSLWWREGIWTDQTTVQTDCEYITDILPVFCLVFFLLTSQTSTYNFYLPCQHFHWCSKKKKN